MVGTADSVLIREMSFIQNALYREVQLYLQSPLGGGGVALVRVDGRVCSDSTASKACKACVLFCMNNDCHLLLSSQLLAGVGHSLAGYHLFAKDPAHKVLPHVFHRVVGGKGRGGVVRDVEKIREKCVGKRRQGERRGGEGKGKRGVWRYGATQRK